jgi:hypothetical protein
LTLNFPLTICVPTLLFTSHSASFFTGTASTFTGGSTLSSFTFTRYTPSGLTEYNSDATTLPLTRVSNLKQVSSPNFSVTDETTTSMVWSCTL